ncbi:interleukin-18-binding protein isoform X2 [Tenrec ecaudatus]|uniref:interleukin-18-binding protein isoform X2 n=1 Tax=Tenrec ecaudatus TaxID=94439 RepID=UPI003F5A2A7D
MLAYPAADLWLPFPRPQSSVGPAPVCPHHPSPGQSHTEPYERHGCNHRGRLAPSSQAVPSTGGDLARDGRLNLSCTGCSQFSHFNLLYWLGNGSFIEHVPGRLWEGNTSRVSSGTSTWLQRALVLDQLTPALRSTNFSCVLLDPAQLAQRHLLLAQLWVGLKTTQSPILPGQESTQPQHRESNIVS